MIFLSAIIIGLLGSLHCVGMCGPIALALPLGQGNWRAKLGGVLLYNSGRVMSYASVGALFGVLGQGFAMAGLQQVLSIGLGFFILIMLLVPAKVKYSWGVSKSFVKWGNTIKDVFGRQLHARRKSSLFAIGFLNGFLPCGLVYMALAGAIATGTAAGGALFMSAFGLGTVPMMFTVAITKNLFSVSFRNHLRKAVPYFISVMAILLVLRGLNLGIPYVSPKVSEHKTLHCCTDKPCRK